MIVTPLTILNWHCASMNQHYLESLDFSLLIQVNFPEYMIVVICNISHGALILKFPGDIMNISKLPKGHKESNQAGQGTL